MRLFSVLRSLLSLVLLTAVLLSGWLFYAWSSSQPLAVAAVRGIETGTTPTEHLAPYPVLESTAPPQINARHYALYNVESGKLIAGEGENDQVPIASTTKLMTSYLASKYGDLNETVIVSSEGAGQIGSLMHLVKGEQISLQNLMYGMLMVSGNDAAYTIAETIGGKLLKNPDASSEEKVARFVQEMNSTAASLHMTNTAYKDPAGLNDEGHSSAFDLAKIASVDYTVPILAKIMGTGNYTETDVSGNYTYTLKNSNRLINDMLYDGGIGGKTGFTPDAGHCLVNAAKRNGVTLIAVVLSTYSDASDASALENKKLLDYGFATFQWN